MTEPNQERATAAATTRYVEMTAWRLLIRSSAANIAILTVVILVATVVYTVLRPNSFNFYTLGNVAVLTQQFPIIAIMAIGAGILMISGEFDLSIAGTYTLAPFVVAVVYNHWGMPLVAACLAGLAVGLTIGLTIGLVVIRLRVPSFIASLGMMFVLRGVVRWISIEESTGQPGKLRLDPPEWFSELLSGQVVGPIHAQFVWLILVAVLSYIVLSRSVLGNHIFATGGDREAAEKIGIKTGRVKLLCFMFCSGCAGFAGLLQTTRINVNDPVTTLSGLELQAIAASVIGGVYLFGGRGTILGMVLGAGLLVTVENILLLVSAPGEYMPVFIGTIVVVSVIMNTNLGSAAGRRAY